ncbi:MAG TPA: GDP-L-fucose synthase [Candidatus Dormibacteraeota bacterium]
MNAAVNGSRAMPWRGKRVVVTGGAGFLGSRVVARLRERGATNILIPRTQTMNLLDRENSRRAVEGADLVIHMAARVGGIGFNRENPGTLFFENVMMGAQLMEEARLAGVPKFVALGTVCAYPKFTPVPFHEDDLWNGYPEETNAPYGLAKKMLLVQAQAYRQQYGFNAIFLLPVNLYGPGDNFDPRSSHVIPALIRKIWSAKHSGADMVEVWGDGSASREFLFVDDAAEAIVLAAERYDGADPVNIGSGMEITVKDLVSLLCELIGYQGKIAWDTSKPNGQPRRSLDVSRAESSFGFRASTDFLSGLRQTVDWWDGVARRELEREITARR